jgi:hypothetical protein
MALVGLDVHREQSVAAVLDPSSGELWVERLRGEPAAVVPVFLERLRRPVRAVYEAGPTGFARSRGGASGDRSAGRGAGVDPAGATAAGSGASASWSPTASARPRPDLRARVSARTRQARPGRRPTGDLGRPPRTQGWESTRMRRRAHVSVLLEDLIKCLMDPIGGAQSNLRDQGWLQIGAPRNPKPVDTLRNAQHRVEGASIG